MIIASNENAGNDRYLPEIFLHSSSVNALAENRYVCTKTATFIGAAL